MKLNCFQGFSLVEILLVLFLLSSLVAWAGLRIEELTSKQLLLRTNRALDEALEHHALLALSRGRPVYLTFDQASGSVNRADALPREGAANPHEQPIFLLPRGIRFRELRLPRLKNQRPHIEFSKNGSATAGTIILADDAGQSCSIVQSLGGKRSLECKEL